VQNGNHNSTENSGEICYTERVKKKTWKIIGIAAGSAAVLAVACFLLLYFCKREAFVFFDACVIAGERGSEEILLSGTCRENPPVPGQKLYLLERKPWEDEATADRAPAAEFSWRTGEFSVSVPLLDGTEDTRLFSSFVAVEKYGNGYREVSGPIYVTNPETVAVWNGAAKEPDSKKGLLIDLDSLEDAAELGVKHAIVNIDISQFFGMGDSYEYEGETYYFNTAFIKKYDDAISAFTQKGITVTAVLLSSWNELWPELRLPGITKTDGANYYLISCATKEGALETAVTAAYLADRYSGQYKEYGCVTNWILGNEINNPDQWNYAGSLSFEEYMREYERSFRVIYTAIRSRSANTSVFYSVDRDWNYQLIAEDGSRKETEKYAAKDVVDRFNADIRSTGNIGWQLAFHPYSDPMTEPEFWTGDNLTRAAESPDAEIINFRNLHVLTDYLQQAEFLTDEGAVRHVILSEQGFTAVSSTRGNVEDLQAEAFERAYRITEENPYIDAFILSRQVDAPPEVNASLAFGLWTCDENGKKKEKRKIWQVFKDIDRNENGQEDE